MRQHIKKGLAIIFWHWPYPGHGQVSAHLSESRIGVGRGGREAALGRLWELLRARSSYHERTRYSEGMFRVTRCIVFNYI